MLIAAYIIIGLCTAIGVRILAQEKVSIVLLLGVAALWPLSVVLTFLAWLSNVEV